MIRRRAPWMICCLLLSTAGAHTRADTPLPRDPNNVYGKFDNGFSYIIRPHENPPKRIALYLHVRTGALNETDVQNGLAHFLEHMAFNGSKHFKPGELVPYMNKLGMRFGADVNAHTNYRETVYKLFMPDNKSESLEKGMTIFSDYADGLLLSDEEIDKERHVVLEEARAGKSARERIEKEWMKHVFENTRISVHDVIGDDSQIEKFPRKEFVDYWNTWYRPENMTLIVVGDVKPDDVIKEARKYFAEIKPRNEGRTPQRTGITPVDKTRAFVFTDSEQVMCQVQMLTIKPRREPIKTYEEYRFNEVENIGTWIVSRRLQEMRKKGEAAFRQAMVGVQDQEHDAITPLGMAFGEPADWNRMLDQVITEIARAIDHGFNERELKLAQTEMLADAERAVQTESTRDANAVINMMSYQVGDEMPILSAQQQLDLLKKILADVSLKEIHDVFVNNFKTSAYTYTISAPDKKDGFKVPTSEDVIAAAKACWARKTEAPADEKTADSILAAKPAAGKVAKSETDDDLKITTLTLDNGAIVHFRQMDYKKDQVMVSVMVPGGSLEETAENRGVGDVAELAFHQPATSRLSSTQITDLMTGKNISVSGNLSADTLTVGISGSPKDLETGFQLAYALLTDGVIEKSAFDNWKKQTLQRLEMMKKNPQGPLRQAMDETFYGGDVRLCELTPAQIEKLDIAKGQAWLRRIASRSAPEITVVGDISLEAATPLICAYLGALPKHEAAADPLASLRKLKRGAGPFERTVHFDSVTPKALVMAGCVGCDERETLDRRLLSMASRIISDRMIKRIREDEQLVYSIQCGSQPSRTMSGLGMFIAAAPTDPHNSEKLADTIIEMIRQFGEKGPTDEEVDVARKQMANSLETQMKEPGFWFGQLNEMNYRHRPLAELKELPDVYQKFTAKQMQDVVKKYMTDDHIIRMSIIPDSKNASADEKKDEAVKPKKRGGKVRVPS